MAYPGPGTIDQVIQSDQALHSSTTPHAHPNGSSVSINMTAPLPSLQSRPRSPREQSKPVAVAANSSRMVSNGFHAPLEKDAQRMENLAAVPEGYSPRLSESSQSSNLTSFFSSEVFQIVLRNPTTAHRFLRFCQNHACGENLEFLQQIDIYNRLLDNVSQTLGKMLTTYTSPDAPKQINVSQSMAKVLTANIKQATQITLPSLEAIFAGAQDHVERLLATDVYPRFVKHQITTSATAALSENREKYQGLGDCFCLTDPSVADNPIHFASDGFVSVTGYSRKDIIPRNCRFLQGRQTDRLCVGRLKGSITACEETVELLLNYRKNGEPFWNLLYVSPLFNERGEVSFFLGGQINCSTTVNSFTDVLKVLSATDDDPESMIAELGRPPRPASQESGKGSKARSTFFKSWRKYSPTENRVNVRGEAGMEGELLNRVGKMQFKTQVEAFYTAYSKYIVLALDSQTLALTVKHYSPGIIDILCLNLPNGSIAPIFHKDIFKILAEHSPSSSANKALKSTVMVKLKSGKAVSVDMGLMTGLEEKKGLGGWLNDDRGKKGGGGREGYRRCEERYIGHWTPLKDEEGVPRWVVLTIAPKDGP